MEQKVEILPSRKKRIGLLFLLLGMVAVVCLTTRFMSTAFLVPMCGLGFALFSHLGRLFSNKPVLVLDDQGLYSNMTYNGKLAGLVPWKEITEIRSVKALGFIKGIEVYTTASKHKFHVHLADDEAVISYKELLDLLVKFWHKYR